MKVLRWSLKYLNFLGMCSENLTDETNDFMTYTPRAYIFLTGYLGPLLTASALYLIRNFTDFETSTNALIVFSAGVACFGAFCTMGVNMKAIKRLYVEFQTLADKEQGKKTFKYYAEAERKGSFYVTRISGFLVLHMSFGEFGLVIVHAIFSMCHGNYHPETWYMPYYLVLPFNSTTYHGYICTLLTNMLTGYTYIFTMSAVVTYFMACCIFIEGCVEHFREKIQVLNEKIIHIESKADYQIAHQLYQDAVTFHVKIIELCDLLADIGSGPIFFQLVCNVVFFASAMFQLMITKSFVDIELAYNVLCMFVGLTWTFLFCYFSSRVTNTLGEIGNIVFDSDWYRYPNSLSKYSVIIILRSQAIYYFTGFKIIRCTLENFTKLTNSAASYFIMFRNLYLRS